MIDLSRRVLVEEEMDGPGVSPAEYARALADLARVNRVTLTHRPVLVWLDRATAGLMQGAAVSVLDVASGPGDLLRAIHRWGRARGFQLSLCGLDLNPRSAVEAAAATPVGMAITWRTGDVFADAPSPRPDFIVSSQFAHHLDDAGVVAFVRWLDRFAGRGWLIADLQRHLIAYYGFPLIARAFGWHDIVRRDGMISIARGFRRAEWQASLDAARVGADITWTVPFRYTVGRLR